MKRVRGYIALLLLTLFTAYQVSMTMFTHVHYLNGVMIVHSHPNKGEHTHSKTELVVIDRISTVRLLEASLSIHIEPLPLSFTYIEVRPEMPITGGIHQLVLSLRGPPSSVA